MSTLDEAKMPSLKDKIREQEKEVKPVKTKEKVEKKLGKKK